MSLLIGNKNVRRSHVPDVSGVVLRIFILFLLLLAVDRSVDHRGSSSIQRCLCLVFIGSGFFFSTHTGLDSGWTGVWLSDSWML